MANEPTITALLARIAGFEKACEFYVHAVGVRGRDDTGVGNAKIVPEAEAIVREVQRFAAEDGGRRYPFLLEEGHSLGVAFGEKSSGIPAVAHLGVTLSTFRGRVEYLLGDSDAQIRSLVTRAFLHLQRSIVADPRLRTTWQEAYQEGETRCEALGAAHLLLHGIWAFKAGGSGERTDLVLGERLTIGSDEREAAEGLVLTEWKVVRSPREADEQYEQAIHQARRYSAGLLAGFELASTRYLVLVSADHLPARQPEVFDGVTYRVVNVSVWPGRPSGPVGRHAR